MISFVVPAHNEELLIGRTLEALARGGRAVGEEFEIIAVDDASEDRTGEIAAGHGAGVVRIERRQIAAARNAGARAARRSAGARVAATRVGGRAGRRWGGGDVLVFVDADTVVPEETLRAALGALRGGAVGGGATVCFDGQVPGWARLMLAVMQAVFRLVGLTGGCFVFCDRRAFEAVGGWDEGVFASEELWLARALGRLGRFVVLRERVVTSGRKVRAHTAGEILGSLVRLGIQGRRGVAKRAGLELWYGPRRADPGELRRRAGEV